MSQRNRRRRSARWLVAAAVATLVASLAGTVPADAATDLRIEVAPNPAAAGVPAEMLAALQRDLHITADQAKARLVRADWAARLQPRLAERTGPAWAGSWLADDGHEYVVAVNDRRLAKMIRASGATPRLVARSEAQLQALADKLASRAKQAGNKPDTLVDWVVDPQINGVRIETLAGGRAAAEAFVAAAGVRADLVRSRRTSATSPNRGA